MMLQMQQISFTCPSKVLYLLLFNKYHFCHHCPQILYLNKIQNSSESQGPHSNACFVVYNKEVFNLFNKITTKPPTRSLNETHTTQPLSNKYIVLTKLQIVIFKCYTTFIYTHLFNLQNLEIISAHLLYTSYLFY